MIKRTKAFVTLYPKGDVIISGVDKECCLIPGADKEYLLPFPIDIYLRRSQEECGFQIDCDVLAVALKHVMLNSGYPNFNNEKEKDKKEV